MKRQVTVLCIIVMLLTLLGPGAGATAQESTAARLAAASFTVRVEDQDGLPTQNATLIVRDGETYKVIANPRTNAEGLVFLNLDPARWYVVLVYYTDRGSRETWWYGYILPKDWNPSPFKVMRRNNPWLGIITMPADPWPVGQAASVQVTVDHGLTTTNYDLKLRVGMWVDDDGQEPYLYETLSDVQSFYNGILPFHVTYTPLTPGHYLVRFRVDRQFEGNDWEVSDEGGWEWSLDIGQPAPTYTSTPTITPVPSATPTLAMCIVQGTVFQDMDYNSVLADQDQPLSGIQVLLKTASGQQIDNQISGVQGRYSFSVSTEGDYHIQLGHVPTGYRHTEIVFVKYCEPGVVHQRLDFPLWRWYCRLPVIVRSE